MKTTIEIPDALLREAKSVAARRGEPLRALFERALTAELAGGEVPGGEAWRAVFARATPSTVEEIDTIVAADLETIDTASWE